jgi:hypothetical protein
MDLDPTSDAIRNKLNKKRAIKMRNKSLTERLKDTKRDLELLLRKINIMYYIQK